MVLSKSFFVSNLRILHQCSMEDTKPVKRGPGRPKKVPKVSKADLLGVIDTPTNTDNRVELCYRNPAAFKKIIDLHADDGANEMKFCFSKQETYVPAKSHTSKTALHLLIVGKNLDSYFCSEPVSATVKVTDMKTVFGSVIKTAKKVRFELRESYRDRMYIIFEGNEYGAIEKFDIAVSQNNILESREIMDQDLLYPLRVNFASDYIKNRFANLSKIHKFVKIQQSGSNLQFTHDKGHGINWTSVYPDKEKLRADIKPNIGLVDVSVSLDYILPFTNSKIGENVTISIDTHKKICMSSVFDNYGTDWVFHIKIYADPRTEVLGS